MSGRGLVSSLLDDEMGAIRNSNRAKSIVSELLDTMFL
jgi:hypothetical protein